ncbi:hypothetical protein M0805_004047 [Coniferiporia weirii]|nr:hypothetical protein M0805_004047 [Coniferiporia weirii]
MSAVSGHVLLQAYDFYGHQKPLCALASKIVHARRVYITHLVSRQLYDKILVELSRQFEPDEAHLRDLIRVVAYETDTDDPFAVDRADPHLAKLYGKIAAGLPIPYGDGSDNTYPGVAPPTLALVDTVAKGLMDSIRSISGDSIKVVLWSSAASSAIYVCAAPLERGGMWGDLDAKLKIYEAKGISGNELHEIGRRLWLKADGEVMNIPGVPPMYDYEGNPQTPPLPLAASAVFFRNFHNMFKTADGAILMSSPHIEGPVIDAFRDMLNTRPVFAMAPLAPPVNQAEIDNSRRDSVVFRETEKFLDDALIKYGENSVIYFSFGTVFWSAEPEKIWTFLDVLLELKIPVIFAHASPIAFIPEEVIKKFDESGLVYHSAWLPQQMILRHKATAWFVSHCGHNSVNESLAEGVPLICWPIMADQPYNAAQLTRLNVSYELFEVRTGTYGLRPVHRLGRAPVGTLEALREETRDMMTRAFGEDGREKRRNAERIRNQISGSWAEEGYCWKEIQGLLDFGLPREAGP